MIKNFACVTGVKPVYEIIHTIQEIFRILEWIAKYSHLSFVRLIIMKIIIMRIINQVNLEKRI